MEVVTGIKPSLPMTISSQLPVQDIGIDQYVTDLIQALGQTYAEVREVNREIAQDREGTTKGTHGRILEQGSLVLRIKTKDNRPTGTHRFQDRYDGHLYRVKREVGANTFTIERISGEPVVNGLGNDVPISGDELVGVSLPELDLGIDENSPTRIEFQNEQNHNQWIGATVDGIAPDGKVFIRYDERPNLRRLVDLTKTIYRWVYGRATSLAEPSRQPPFSPLN